MPFIVNRSSMSIRMRNGVSVPGYSFIKSVARVMAPGTEIDLSAIPASFWPVIQRCPSAQCAVELWLGDYGYRRGVVLKVGASIVAVDSHIWPSAVDILYEQYLFDGRRRRRHLVILFTIYPDPRG